MLKERKKEEIITGDRVREKNMKGKKEDRQRIV